MGGFIPSFFFACRFLSGGPRWLLSVALQQTIDDTVRGLGYDLVEIERSAGGLLRVTIDFPWSADAQPAPITVED